MECTVDWVAASGMTFVAETGSGHLLTMDGAADGVRYRHGQWLPDGATLVGVSDASGEERIEVLAAGEVRALAVSSLKRSAYLPNVPTTLESGYPNSDYLFWLGVFAPRGTPQPILDRLYTEIRKAFDDANVRSVLAKQGADPMPLDPKALTSIP